VRALVGLAVAAVLGIRPAAALPVPGAPDWLEAGGYVDGLAVVDTGSGPRQRPQALGVLRLDARPLGWLRGRLELRGRLGGPFEDAHAGIYDLVHTYQNHSPSLEVNEAYADLALPRTDVRVGLQKLSWGRLDGLPPTDVVNPRDFHDPFVIDIEEAKIGVPALLGTHYLPTPRGSGLGELRASLLFLPLAVPSRLALLGERWFPSSLSPGTIVLPRRQVELAIERLPGLDVNQDFVVPQDVPAPGPLLTANNRPPVRWSTTGVAARLAGTWRGMDLALTHYTGPEAGPDVDLRSTVVLVEENRNGSEIQPVIRSRSVLRQAFDRMHMTGADWATTLGPFTARAEGAFFQDRPFLRLSSDLVSGAPLRALIVRSAPVLFGRRRRTTIHFPPLFPALDAFEWGVGADVTRAGVFALAQLTQIVLLEDAPRLVIGDPETRLLALLRRSFLRDRLELELRAVYAVERGGWFAFPRASWSLRDDLRLRVGYLAIGGPRNSLFGQFGRNDEVVFQVRQSF
jgi:hypothetical protein